MNPLIPRSSPLPPAQLRRQAEESAAALPALMAAAEKAAAGVLHGGHRQRKPGMGERFWQFREYDPQDRPQDIDWRQSAKTQRVYIRQKEWQTPQATLFWCASHAGMDFRSSKRWPEKGEAAKILVLALALLMTRAGEQAGILARGRRGRSEAALERIAQTLCDPQESESLPHAAAGDIPARASLVLAGDFLDTPEDIEAALSFAAAREGGVTLIQVLDPAEIDLPYSGRVVFEAPGGNLREHVAHVSSIRDAYRQRLQHHLKALENMCRQRGWNYFLHRTDHDPAGTLAAIWLATADGAADHERQHLT